MHIDADERAAVLEIPAQTAFAPLVQAAVETACAAFGLTGAGAMRLTLAVDEVFGYLCANIRRGTAQLRLSPGGWFVRAAFACDACDIDLAALNITAKHCVSAESDPGDLDCLGLLLASRSADRLEVRREGGRLALVLDKEKDYPDPAQDAAAAFAAEPPFSIRDDPAGPALMEACAKAMAAYPAQLVHKDMRKPGKFAAMVAAGDMNALVAVDGRGRVCGMLCFDGDRPGSRAFYGAYVFCENMREDVGALLAEDFLARMAKSEAGAVIGRLVTPETPAALFEPLGEIPFVHPDGQAARLTILYRQLCEEKGCVIYAHPRLVPFLQENYERLDLLREIHPVEGAGALAAGRSVFATAVDRVLGEAVIETMLDGEDRADNLRAHAEALAASGVRNIFFRLDLAEGVLAQTAADLMDAGFTPVLVLPGESASDVVLFRHGGE
jgi:hypothetical protein